MSDNLSIRTTLARLMVVQAIYNKQSVEDASDDWDIDFHDDDMIEFLHENSQGEIDDGDEDLDITEKADKGFYRKLFDGITGDIEKLDGVIVNYLDDDWKIERMGMVLLCILRSATYEILEEKNTPSKVIINEYISIANLFLDDYEIGFVNAILARIASEVRKEELDNKLESELQDLGKAILGVEDEDSENDGAKSEIKSTEEAIKEAEELDSDEKEKVKTVIIQKKPPVIGATDIKKKLTIDKGKSR